MILTLNILGTLTSGNTAGNPATIMLNAKTLDNTGLLYLEFKGAVVS